ncbi:imidazolonepropionase [Marinilabilia salmonicolor]|jgi:imidazolonepropionase|uniref:imidazolonepropionase n=1 Tax=Marinilabilia salmonicolor TaxID=989 RepID=UPI000D05307A|nr:imidazolonepropionase [Marinilabilia salmonicolor]PRZ00630.1 imidazolonepropionase [Marinilabilia salmonicolor]
MNTLLIKNIKQLVSANNTPPQKVSGKSMQDLPVIENGWLLIKNGIISDFGPMNELPQSQTGEVLDASDRLVLPAWCDSHTHLVFPQSREIEYTDKIKGLSYEEIAKRGGGILNSAKKMQKAGEDQLFEDAMLRLQEIVRWGTGAVEIKSGYGLTTETELKMLRVIKRLKKESPVTIRSTFLGAHAVPAEFKETPDKYVDLVINEMLPAVAAEQLADFVDVFCDRGFFSVNQTDRILEAAAKYGLQPKIHANELDFSGGIQTGIKYKALSVDHLEYTGEEEIKALLNSDTMPVILPGAAFFLNLKYAPAREIIDAGLPLTLATDFNPGSSPSGNMQLIISMASILYKMLPREALNAVTINGAYAMGLQNELGTITKGKKANLIITKPIPGIEYIPYAYGENKVEKTILNGKIQ